MNWYWIKAGVGTEYFISGSHCILRNAALSGAPIFSNLVANVMETLREVLCYKQYQDVSCMYGGKSG